MKNILSTTLIWFVLLLVPLVVLPLAYKRNATPLPTIPEITQPIVESVEPINATKPVAPIPSSTFMKGYWDGWHRIWLGPIRWTISDDYRQGHMLGAYDRKHNIERYTPDQR